jgi:hypothetical protein
MVTKIKNYIFGLTLIKGFFFGLLCILTVLMLWNEGKKLYLNEWPFEVLHVHSIKVKNPTGTFYKPGEFVAYTVTYDKVLDWGGSVLTRQLVSDKGNLEPIVSSPPKKEIGYNKTDISAMFIASRAEQAEYFMMWEACYPVPGNADRKICAKGKSDGFYVMPDHQEQGEQGKQGATGKQGTTGKTGAKGDKGKNFWGK